VDGAGRAAVTAVNAQLRAGRGLDDGPIDFGSFVGETILSHLSN
jgi:hypothetical protein